MASPGFKTFDIDGKKHCQKCFRANTKEHPLLTCACKHVLYCDKACQKADWKVHKSMCQHNRAAVESAESSGLTHPNGVLISDALEITKKWVQITKCVLGGLAIEALHLQKYSHRIDTHLVRVVLKTKFNGQTIPKSNKDISRSFQLVSAEMMTREAFLAQSSPHERGFMKESLETALVKSEEFRQQGNGWVGVVVNVLVFPDLGNTMRVVPWGAQNPLPLHNLNWLSFAKGVIDQGLAYNYRDSL